MTKRRTETRTILVAFDAARYLNDDEAIAEYLTIVIEADEPDLLLLALSDVARAKALAQIAKHATQRLDWGRS
jgi:probable addiction module antidote protein